MGAIFEICNCGHSILELADILTNTSSARAETEHGY